MSANDEARRWTTGPGPEGGAPGPWHVCTRCGRPVTPDRPGNDPLGHKLMVRHEEGADEWGPQGCEAQR